MDAFDKETRLKDKRAFKNGLIITFVFMMVWAIVLEFIPGGWWVLAINIVGISLTAWILLSTAISFFKLYLSTIIAVVVSVGLWFIMFLAIRFVISVILGTT